MINTPEYIIDLKKRQKKRGLLTPNNKKEKRVKFRVNDEWLTVEECIAKGLKVTVKKGDEFVEVSTNKEVLESLNLNNKLEETSNNEIKNVEKVITKEDLEERIQRLREKLEFMYSDNELVDTMATIHKEGQMYAYKSLLRQLSEK